MQVSITINKIILNEIDELALKKFGKNRRSLLIQLAIKDYLMKERSKKA